MPAESEEQRRLMAIALQIKRGELPASYSPEAAKLARTMTERQLRDYAKKPVKEATKPKRKKGGRRR